MAIARELLKLQPATTIEFASYATGAATLRAGGWAVFDLGFPEDNPYLPTLAAASALIRSRSPDVVFSHEEFAALPAAHLESIKTIFISAWLPYGPNLATESMQYADASIIFEDEGIFPLPPAMPAPPRFVGPLFRELQYGRADRARARRELALPAQSPVVTVLPGSYVGEADCPIAEVVVAALQQVPNATLMWVTGRDYAPIKRATRRYPRIRLVRHTPVVEQIIAASDVVITKGTRGATFDAAAVGVPTISLSPRNNPIDDLLVARVPTNISLTAGAVTPHALRGALQQALHPHSWKHAAQPLRGTGARGVADAMLQELERLIGARPARAT